MSDITVSVTGQPAVSVEVSNAGATGPQGPGPSEEVVADAVEEYVTENPPTAGPHTHPQSEVVGLVDALAAKAPLESPAFTGTPTGITKTHVGLGSVDNTSDAAKPVSTATQAALDGKSDTGHSHTSASVTDFVEAVQDAVAAFIAEGANITLVHDDEGNTLTVSASGGGGSDAEAIRDAIGAAIVGLGNISVLVDDEADTITIVTTATVNSTDAALRDRSTHTGTQSADTITDGTTNHVFTAADDTKLAGIATGATANDTDANLKNRANHTGTQTASTISDFNTAADARVSAARGLYVGVNAQTGTTYTIVLADRGKLVTLSNTGAITVTLPQDSDVAIAVGGQVDFVGLNTGLVTFAAGTGATVNGTPSLVTRAQYSAATAIKVAANSWVVVGDLA